MLKVIFFSLLATMALYSIEGKYEGAGTDPYEKAAYSVKATFTEDKNGVTQATWQEVEKGKTSEYTGTGLKMGDMLSFMYQNTKNATDKGLQLYTIKEDTLEGPFVAFGKNLVGNEKLTKLK